MPSSARLIALTAKRLAPSGSLRSHGSSSWITSAPAFCRSRASSFTATAKSIAGNPAGCPAPRPVSENRPRPPPHPSHPHSRHGLRLEHILVDQPVRLRVRADDGRRQQLLGHVRDPCSSRCYLNSRAIATLIS